MPTTPQITLTATPLNAAKGKVGVALGVLRFTSVPLIEVRWMLDRVSMGLVTGLYLSGGIVLAIESRRSEDPIVRQQLKWLRNGTLTRRSTGVWCSIFRPRWSPRSFRS